MVTALQAHDVPAAPVLDVQQAVDSAHAIDRRLVVRRPNAGGGIDCHIEQPVHFGDLPRGTTSPAPDLGAHTRTTLELLGFGADDIQRFQNEGLTA